MFVSLLSVAAIGWIPSPGLGPINHDFHTRRVVVTTTATVQRDSQPNPWSDALQEKLKVSQEKDRAEANHHRTVDIPSMGPVQSPHDTTQATIGAAKVSVAYGRPSMKGRKIFGGLVPYNRVWRTGANEATLLTTDKDIIIGGLPVSAGTYTLYTIPSESGWQLVINREVGQWGTSYHQEFDYGRVSMTTSASKEPVEKLLIELQKGKLLMSWANTVAEVPIAQKKK